MPSSRYRSKPKPEHRERPKDRSCLKCKRPFRSTWAGERVCQKCKSGHEWRQGEPWLPGGAYVG